MKAGHKRGDLSYREESLRKVRKFLTGKKSTIAQITLECNLLFYEWQDARLQLLQTGELKSDRKGSFWIEDKAA